MEGLHQCFTGLSLRCMHLFTDFLRLSGPNGFADKSDIGQTHDTQA